MANVVMEHLEKRYVDDVCSATKQSQTTVLKSHLNFCITCDPVHSWDPTVEHESNNSIAFIDALLRHEGDGQLSTTVYPKPTHTDRLIYPCLPYDGSLVDRVARLPTTTKDRKKEAQPVISTLKDNGYPKCFILKTTQQTENTCTKKIHKQNGDASVPCPICSTKSEGCSNTYKHNRQLVAETERSIDTRRNSRCNYRISCIDCEKPVLRRRNQTEI